MINERIKRLRELMSDNEIDLYIIPTSDYHQSEYVSGYFKSRAYMSGFTGSAGTMIVTKEEALLWVDGRYYIQGEKQTQGSEIIIMKMGLKGVETIDEFLARHKEAIIGFDGKVMSYKSISRLPNKIVSHLDLIDMIWKDRPALSKELAYLFDEKYCGESRTSKLSRVREAMSDCNHLIITSLDDIVWLYNIRGNDVPRNPVINSYTIINKNDAYLYVQQGVISAADAKVLAQDNVSIREYNEIYQDVENLCGNVMLDTNTVNYALVNKMIDAKIIDNVNPTQLFKAIKNETEIKATKNAHLKDGVAMTKFMYWLKQTVGKEELTEVSISDKLEAFRKEQPLFKDLSFDTICAYKENAALMHYKAEIDDCAKVTNKGMLLIDSGGQYLDGTIDTTRTFVLGNLTDEERRDFTIALKAMFRLQRAHFIQGTTGTNLDILARGMVYDYDLDYRCGTGHGVGHFLNVHEGPNGFRPRDLPGRKGCAILPGMITTDEPGIYKEGLHGIRHENELLCVAGENNEYGQFLHFEVITMVPFDIDGLDYDLLSNHEVQQINDYQKLVFNKIQDFLSPEEKDWYLTTLIIK